MSVKKGGMVARTRTNIGETMTMTKILGAFALRLRNPSYLMHERSNKYNRNQKIFSLLHVNKRFVTGRIFPHIC